MDDGLNEFPVGSREVCDFERSLTALYCGIVYARERRSKNIVQSITLYKEEFGLQHEYLVVKIKNHQNRDSTILRLERGANDMESTTSPLPTPHPDEENGHDVAAISPKSPSAASIHMSKITPPLSTPHPGEENGHDAAAVETPSRISRRPSASLSGASAASIRMSKTYLGTKFALDTIEIFEGPIDDKVCGRIDFENDTFTLHTLALIAKVVHEARDKYHIKRANCYWFAAMVLGVATVAYDGAAAPGIKPCGGTILGFKVPGASIKREVELALSVFKNLEDEREEQIRKAVRAESQNKSQDQRETEQAKKLAKQAMHETEEAKREIKAKDAEIIQLKRLLAQNGIRGPVERS